MEEINTGAAANMELLVETLEPAKKRKLIPWKNMLCTGLACAAMIVVGLALLPGYGGYELLIFGGTFGMMWLVVAIGYGRVLWKIRMLEAWLREHPSEVCRMVLSGRVVAWYSRFAIAPVLDEQEVARGRKRLRACFPWAELLFASPAAVAYIIFLCIDGFSDNTFAIIAVSMLLGAFAIRLFLQLVPSLCNHRRRLEHLGLSERPGAREIVFIAAEARSQVAVSFDGCMTWFHNIGQLPAVPPRCENEFFLAKSQLKAHYVDGQIVSWSLKMIYGVSVQRGKPWLVMQRHFPVEVSKVQELHQWLATEPRTTLFRFCGTTFTAAEIRPTRAMLISPHNGCHEAGGFPVDQRPAIVLTASLSCDQSGVARVSLLSMAGNEVTVLRLPLTDSVADLWWEIDSHAEFAGQRVALTLTDGRSLDDTRTHPMKLAEVVQALPGDA